MMCQHDRYMYLNSICSEPQCESDKAKMVNCLVSNGSEANATDSRGKSPLHLAVTMKYARVAEVLLDKGADPNLADEKVNINI